MIHAGRADGARALNERRTGVRVATLRKLTAMRTRREYEVVLTPQDEGGYSVAVPALPGCTSQGETRDEALVMIREAIEVYLESLEAHGDPIPGPIEIERVTVHA